MSVDSVLQKISAHNSDVLGCIASWGDALHDNLPELYELVDKQEIAEHATNMFAATDALETEHEPFNQLFLEYKGHSIYARRLEEGVLVLLNAPVQRAQFKKMQIGVNLFMKPLKAALAEKPADASDLVADKQLDGTSKPPEVKRGLLARAFRGGR